MNISCYLMPRDVRIADTVCVSYVADTDTFSADVFQGADYPFDMVDQLGYRADRPIHDADVVLTTVRRYAFIPVGLRATLVALQRTRHTPGGLDELARIPTPVHWTATGPIYPSA